MNSRGCVVIGLLLAAVVAAILICRNSGAKVYLVVDRAKGRQEVAIYYEFDGIRDAEPTWLVRTFGTKEDVYWLDFRKINNVKDVDDRAYWREFDSFDADEMRPYQKSCAFWLEQILPGRPKYSFEQKAFATAAKAARRMR